jgi:hypothetical protein
MAHPSPTALDPGAGVTTWGVRPGTVNGRDVPVHMGNTLNSGYFVPDGQGGYIWAGARAPMPYPNPAHENARELRLKVRELGEQLLADAPESLRGTVALPTAFVHQDNFDLSSSFGRYLAEQMFHEFNSRGFPVREYRLNASVEPRARRGEFGLTRQGRSISTDNPDAVFLVGTYYHDYENVFVNARLVRGGDGMVLRTGLVALPVTPLTGRMLAETGPVQLEQAFIEVKDYETMTRGAEQSDIDLGFEVR